MQLYRLIKAIYFRLVEIVLLNAITTVMHL